MKEQDSQPVTVSHDPSPSPNPRRSFHVMVCLTEEEFNMLERIRDAGLVRGRSGALRWALRLQASRMLNGNLSGSSILSMREGGSLRKLFDDLNGVVYAEDLSDFFEVSLAWVRKWAKDNSVSKAGSRFLFDINLSKKMMNCVNNSFVESKTYKMRKIKTLGELIDKTVSRQK